jgi:hypothetical protein
VSTYRCRGCRAYRKTPPYRTLSLGSVCCAACLAEVNRRANRPPSPQRARSVPPSVPDAVRARVMQRDRTCRICNATARHLHHIDYRSQGGAHVEHNLILLCDQHHRLVHSDKRHWQPRLRAYIWTCYVHGRSCFLADVEAVIARAGIVSPAS